MRVQHHYAHILSCMAENEMDLTQPVLGISWDGTGYGTDGTVWGGEFLRGKGASFKRIAHLATFSLPGGDRAVKEPRRTAMGLLYEVYGDRAFDMPELAPVRNCTPQELEILKAMLHRKINCPVTSSAGRLFDAVAAILNLRQKSGYEGQAAMDLEFAIDGVATEKYYEFEIREPSGQPPRGGLIVDWAQPVREIVSEVNRHISLSCISARFHNTLVEMMVQVAQRAGEERVVLTGGCFQNKYLTERAVHRLREAGFRPYWHQRIPPNDGGIALGQVIAAALGR